MRLSDIFKRKPKQRPMGKRTKSDNSFRLVEQVNPSSKGLCAKLKDGGNKHE
jgi:hypothetical protein